ncbi:MAG: hypothetical protein M3P85_03110 [Actinomycetota bacterium]|nr:hypothetical protein [Actinomycetota bacterium]PLS75957.1 MAG: hypothetical protein CYG61_04630 [Actinomycetota bacterium]
MSPELIDPAALGLDIDDSGRAVLSAAGVADVLRLAGLDLDPTVVEHVAAGFDVEMPPFEMRLGSWQLDLPVAAARGIVNGVVLTSVLAAQQQASIPATVLSVVVPLLFNLERVRLSASERAVYAELLRGAPDRKAVDEWHQSLPDHVR